MLKIPNRVFSHLKPLDEEGERIALWNDKGDPITRLELAGSAATPPYRSS